MYSEVLVGLETCILGQGSAGWKLKVRVAYSDRDRPTEESRDLVYSEVWSGGSWLETCILRQGCAGWKLKLR